MILRGKVRVTTHRDDGSIIEDMVLCNEEGRYGVNIPKGVWHTINSVNIEKHRKDEKNWNKNRKNSFQEHKSYRLLQ